MKKLPVSKVTHWDAPPKNDVRVLGMPNIPKPLHGCLEGEAEVLTPDGWRRIDSVAIGDNVMCWGEGCLFFDTVQDTIVTDVSTAYKIGFKKAKNFDMLYSPGHRIPMIETLYTWGQHGRHKYEQPKRVLRVKTAQEYNPDPGKKFITAARGTGESSHLTADERVLIAIQADGHLLHKNQDGRYVYYLSFKKARKITRIRKLLKESSYRWSEGDNGDEYKGYRVWVDKEAKTFSHTFSWGMPYVKAREFIQELWEWDGYVGKSQFGTQRASYHSSRYDNVSFVQAIAAQAGYTTTTRKDIRSGTITNDGKAHRDCWTVEFVDKTTRGCGHTKKEAVLYNGVMYCITVPSSFFLVKYHDIVMVTGNSGCQPRTIVGSGNWDKMRKKCYADAGYKCEICSYKHQAPADLHAHEVFSIDYEKGESKFERLICLCKRCHLDFIHSGRALTLYKSGSPLYSKEKLLEGAEHGFKLIAEYNKTHKDKTHKEKVKVFSAMTDYLKQPELKEDMNKLIEKYGIEFYSPISVKKGAAKWGDWKMVYNGKEYHTPYKDEAEWAKAMEKNNKTENRDKHLSAFSEEKEEKFNKELKEGNWE